MASFAATNRMISSWPFSKAFNPFKASKTMSSSQWAGSVKSSLGYDWWARFLHPLDIVRRATWYRDGCAHGSDCDRSSEQQWQAGHGVDCGNQSQQHSAVYPRSTGRVACDVRRGDLGGLAL